ncbi:MAG: ribonuclease III [Gammaproteobacteria bacterium]|nr:ribonuclease III [Gammaproteobacteria bacterium]
MNPAAAWSRERLGHDFTDSSLLDLALTHRSASARNNERLEFLGDAVLGMVVARAVFERRPDAAEGLLSRLRARLVRGETLAEVAREIGIAEVLRLGSGESRTGGFQRASTLSNAVEAVLGAIYLDAGFAAAEKVILALLADRLDRLPDEDELSDPKTRLQEWLQARGLRPPVYVVVAVAGASHAQTFEVTCSVECSDQVFAGHGSSRRHAEQEAATHALACIRDE